MPFLDLMQQHFVAADITAVDAAITTLENTIAPKSRNLTPEERQRFGSINEQNKLLVNKVRDYRLAQSTLSSPDVNWAEFELDYADRNFLETRINRLRSLLEMMMNAKILHDHDNYQNSLTDYAYTQYKADTEAGGYVTKRDEIRQFFPNASGSGGTEPEPLAPNP